MTNTKSKHVVVLGAGITGLQTAFYLQRAGYRTTIIAQHGPGDENPLYTSPWAGAQWRSHAKEDDFEQQEWDRETYREWMGMVKRGEGREAGLGLVPSTLYWSSHTAPTEWWHTTVSLLPTTPNLPRGMHSSISFSTLCINAPYHLHYLLSRILAAGGELLKARLPVDDGLIGALKAAAALAKDATGDEVCNFVNATSLGARTLVPDKGMFPVKGQTVLVRGEAREARTLGDGKLYVIPRPGSGTTILGGMREVGNWDTTVDEETTKAILGGCKELAPELLRKDGEFEVMSEQCGLRPGRERGPRVETELVEGGFKIVHSYGHAGAGYQNSVGCARKVVRLMKELDSQVSVQAKL